MFVSMFNVGVDSVEVNDSSTTLRLKDGNGNIITLFFDSLQDVNNFSKDIRTSTLEEANNLWESFDRPALITDREV